MKNDDATQLKTLMELAATINSTLDGREVRTRAIEAATRLVGAETGSLLLHDPATNELYFEVALGEKGERLKEIRIPADQGFAGWSFTHSEGLIITDPDNDPRFFRGADQKSSFRTRSLLVAPLRIKGRTIGVLEAINKIEGDFDGRDLDILTCLANQVAPAIENAALYAELRELFLETALTLSEALECRDTYTGGHTRRVRDYSVAIGKRLGLSLQELEHLNLAAILHDIGKIGVDDAILRKQGPLDRDEFIKMMEHAQIGADILQYVRSMVPVVPGVRYHHEKYDGTGYPERLRGEDIPFLARIIAVADTFDAMTTDRPYRKGLTRETALAELEKCSGTQFDPEIARVFIDILMEEMGEVPP
ncbi:MAG: HD domain-containing protein [Desulfuromonadia bacterium]